MSLEAIKNAELVEEVWPDVEPLPSGLPAVQPFPLMILPDPMRDWIGDITERTKCAPDYPAVAGMVALASLVGKQVGIRPKKKDNWLVVPNLWGALIGRPSTMKTPSISEAAANPLKHLRYSATEANKGAAKSFETDKILFDAQLAGSKALLKKEAAKPKPDRIEMERLTRSIQQQTGEDEKPPQARRYVVNDSTPEALADLLESNPFGLLVLRDELAGWLQSMDKQGHETARAFYLEAWNGSGSFEIDRVTEGRSTYVEACCISVLGGIQAGKLASYIQSAQAGGAGDDGFMQRFQLAVYPDKQKWHLIDRYPNKEARQAYWDVFERLNNIDLAAIGAQQDEYEPIPFLRFADDAQELFYSWLNGLQTELGSDDLPEVLEAHFAKYRSLVPSLALIIHLAEGRTGAVSYEATEKAVEWAKYLRSHAQRIFAPVTAVTAHTARRLAKKILDGALPDDFTLRDTYRSGWAGLSDKTANISALEMLVELGGIVEETHQTGGRPLTSYRLNPKAKTAWGDV